jgi:hypothetical protein
LTKQPPKTPQRSRQVGTPHTFLKNVFITNPPHCTTPVPCRHVQQMSSSRSNASKGSADYPCNIPHTLSDKWYGPADDFFWDVPWLNVPESRLGTITMEPRYPSIGLLGGSKLAALAAARKKRQEEANKPKPSDVAAGRPEGDTDHAVALLDKLDVTNKERLVPATQGREGEETSRSGQRRYPRKNEPVSTSPNQVRTISCSAPRARRRCRAEDVNATFQ